MSRPPRDPKVQIINRGAITMWLVYGFTLFVAAFIPYSSARLSQCGRGQRP